MSSFSAMMLIPKDEYKKNKKGSNGQDSHNQQESKNSKILHYELGEQSRITLVQNDCKHDKRPIDTGTKV